MIHSTPYVKEYDKYGSLLNPIVLKYLYFRTIKTGEGAFGTQTENRIIIYVIMAPSKKTYDTDDEALEIIGIIPDE